MCSCGPLHMANQKQDDQLEHSYSSYVMIRDVTPKACPRRWMIGRRGERGSEISVLAARHDDDDVYVRIWLSHMHCETLNIYQKCWLVPDHHLRSTSHFWLHSPVSIFLTARFSIDCSGSTSLNRLTSRGSWAPNVWLSNSKFDS